MSVMRGVLVFVGLVMTDRTTCGRSQQAMVAGEVSGDAADHRSFNAAFGAGGTRGTCDKQRQSRASNKLIHVSRTPFRKNNSAKTSM